MNDVCVSIEQHGCTLRIILADVFMAPYDIGPLRLRMMAPTISVSFCDDSRGRLSGCPQELVRVEMQEVFFSYCHNSTASKRLMSTRLCIRQIECAALYPSHARILSFSADAEGMFDFTVKVNHN